MPERSGARMWQVLPVLCAAQFMAVFSMTVVVVALPQIQQDIDLDVRELTWVVNVYALTFGGFLVLGGRVADRLGRRWTLLVGLTTFATASVPCGLADTALPLFVGRGVQGLGAAMMAPSSLAILVSTFPGASGRRALSLWAAVNATGGSLALIGGGLLLEHLSWSAVLLLNLPAGVVIALVARSTVSESRGSAGAGIDAVAACAFTGGTAIMIYAMFAISRYSSSAAWTALMIATGCVLLVVFVLRQRTSPAPLIELRLLRNRAVVVGNITMFVVAGMSMTAMYVVTLSMQYGIGRSAGQTAISLLPISAGLALGSLSGHWIVARVGTRIALAASCAVAGSAAAVIATRGGVARDPELVLPIMLLMYVGIGCAMVTSNMLVTLTSDRSRSGVAAGLIGTSQQVGIAFWLAVASMIIALGPSTHAGSTSGGSCWGRQEQIAFTGIAVLIAVLGLITLIMTRRIGEGDISHARSAQ